MKLAHKLALCLQEWQGKRAGWILLAGVSLGLVVLSHYVLQVYGYMRPCEQCVYIRYAFIVQAFGALIIALAPRSALAFGIGGVCMLYAGVRGIMSAWQLHRIHTAIHSDEVVFGVRGCSMEAHFDFGLPLDRWLPEWFAPSGDCGLDAPIIPSGVVLSGVQKAFVELYANGWYLLPRWEIGTMAQCCLLVFGVCVAIMAACVWFRLWSR